MPETKGPSQSTITLHPPLFLVSLHSSSLSLVTDSIASSPSLGTTLYNINEKAAILCVSQKHKMKIFHWQSGIGGFILRREMSYSESPRAILCIGGSTGSIIVGFKKHYEVTDLQTYNAVRLLEFEKEHRLVAFEVYLSLSPSITVAPPHSNSLSLFVCAPSLILSLSVSLCLCLSLSLSLPLSASVSLSLSLFLDSCDFLKK
jgi:hypothetical protein